MEEVGTWEFEGGHVCVCVRWCTMPTICVFGGQQMDAHNCCIVFGGLYELRFICHSLSTTLLHIVHQGMYLTLSRSLLLPFYCVVLGTHIANNGAHGLPPQHPLCITNLEGKDKMCVSFSWALIIMIVTTWNYDFCLHFHVLSVLICSLTLTHTYIYIYTYIYIKLYNTHIYIKTHTHIYITM